MLNAFFGGKHHEHKQHGNNVVALITMKGSVEESDAEGITAKQELNFRTTKRLIEEAFALPNVLAVIMNINCPGGSPAQTNLIAKFIRERADETKRPLYAVVEDAAVSGGYWLACAADEIHIDPNSMVGSVGVISQNVGVNEGLGNAGVEPRIITSVEHKAGMNPLLKFDEEEEKLVRENIMTIHGNFIDFLKQRRPEMMKGPHAKDIMSGRMYVGEMAVEVGLADGLASISTLLDKKYPKRDDLQVMEIKPKPQGGLLGLVGRMVYFGTQIARQMNGVLGELERLDVVRSPRPEALYLQKLRESGRTIPTK